MLGFSAISWVIIVATVALYFLLLTTMLRGSIARYPYVFGYIALQLLASVVQISSAYYFGVRSREYARVYWINDFISTALILTIIIHLIRAAMQRHRYRDTVYWGLLLGAVATAVTSVLLMRAYSRGFHLNEWMTLVSRNYYFAAVVLNLVLWVLLVRSNHESKQLYLLTSGLGLQLTGAAIAHALRTTGNFLAVAQYLLSLTYFANLYVWYVALKSFPLAAAVGAKLDPAAPRPVETISTRN